MEEIESFEDRLRRFTFGKAVEVFAGITNNIACTFKGELEIARAKEMTTTICLLTHAIIQTVAAKMYSKTGKDSTKFFLETFVDGDTQALKFSDIAGTLHSWRNVTAHQIFFKEGHTLCIDYGMSEGWKRENGVLYINPGKYADRYLKMFHRGSPFWSHWKQQPETAQKVCKYRFVADYLGLSKNHDIRRKINELLTDLDEQTFLEREAEIQLLLKQRYRL